jgi:uroporphyrinogen decarboxylase
MIKTDNGLDRPLGIPNLVEMAHNAYDEGRRLVVPLMGFPGVRLTGTSIKLAQQNFGEHYKAIRKLALTYRPDVIFPLMDLSVEANANGRYTVFPKNDSATVPKDRFDLADLDRLRRIKFAFDSRVISNIETVKHLSIGLASEMVIGAYVTGPYTLAALIMGSDEAAACTIIEPDTLEQLCIYSTERIMEYISLLTGAGAQAICILEPSAVMLGPEQFKRFSADFVRHMVESLKYSGINMIYHTCGNTMHIVDQMVAAGVNGVSLDSADTGVDLKKVAGMVPENVLVIGNINPTNTMCGGTPESVEKEVSELLRTMDPYPNYVLSTGCDLPFETPAENIDAFMRAGKGHRVK